MPISPHIKGVMEAFLPLGCVVSRSSSMLRLTADPKERLVAMLFATAVGCSALWVLLLVPLAQVGWAGLILLSTFGLSWLSLAWLIGLWRTEIEFHRPQGQLVCRRFCLGRLRSQSVLALHQLQSIRVVRKGKGAGELQLLQQDGKVWAKWVFLVAEAAEETRQEILAWLQESSACSDWRSER